MNRLPEPLTTFKEFVEADLRRAARLVIKVQDEIDPQFRIATPEGDYSLAVTLPARAVDRPGASWSRDDRPVAARRALDRCERAGDAR